MKDWESKSIRNPDEFIDRIGEAIINKYYWTFPPEYRKGKFADMTIKERLQVCIENRLNIDDLLDIVREEYEEEFNDCIC